MFSRKHSDGFPARASFELTEEDLEAARAGVVPDLGQYPRPPPSAAQRQALQEWNEWKVCGWDLWRGVPGGLCVDNNTWWKRCGAHGMYTWCTPASQAKYPDMLQRFQDFANAARQKRVAVFLDYDGMCVVGTHVLVYTHTLLYIQTHVLVCAHFCTHTHTGTLAPIVNDPDRAFMSDEVCIHKEHACSCSTTVRMCVFV